jgi:thiol:disulfide interchange protein DsbD
MTMHRFPRAALAAFLTLSATLAAAQPVSDPLPAEEAFALTVDRAGQSLSLTWEIADGYYLYREHLGALGPEGTPLTLQTPTGEMKDDPNFGRTEIYHDAVTARIDGARGPVEVTWQGCMEDGICYPPQTRVIGAGGGGEQAAATTSAGTSDTAADTRRGAFSTDASRTGAATEDGRVVTLADEDTTLTGLSDRGGGALVAAAFLGFGLLLAFTPCVFPMFPIVAGMVMGRGERVSTRRGIVLSGSYVLAMATAFALLGVIAAWSGRNLQVALQSPGAVGAAAAIFVLLALAMFGLFDLQMPRAVAARLERLRGRSGSIGGAALLGVTSALIVGPCVTAPLAGALLYIAQTGDVALGALALFTLGLGQGLPLLAIGAFGPRVLPRSGPWMEGARKLFGLVFLGFAIWLVGRVMPGALNLALWSALLIGAGASLATAPRAEGASRLGGAVGTILMFAGALQGTGAALGADDPLRPLEPLVGNLRAVEAGRPSFETVRTRTDLEATLAGTTRPALVYVTADWCTTCRTIERGPLADPAVQAELEELAAIKLDVTEFGAQSQGALDMLGAAGPPTMVFLDAQGTEPAESRIVGTTARDEMLSSIRMVAP